MNDQNFRKRKIPIGSRWRLDETYIKVNGKWCYLYRAVDKEGKTIDFLLTHRRKKRSAHRFLAKAITQNEIPKLINIDKCSSRDSLYVVPYGKFSVTTLNPPVPKKNGLVIFVLAKKL